MTVPAFSVATAFTDWTFQWAVSAGVAVALVLYACGVLALRRRGDAWPPGRTLAYVLGLALLVFALESGLGTYDDTFFSAHMVQHMLLAMVAPIPLALSAPVTLALRVLPKRGRQFLLWLLHTPVSRVLTNPAFAFCLFIGSPFALYFTGIYPYSLWHTWAHDLVHLHFVVTGCLFAWVVVGVDPLPHRPGNGMRMLMVVAALPFHAFLGIALYTQDSVIALTQYSRTGRSYADLLSDQHTGAGLLWASGEFIGLALVFSVLGQWMRSEERAATRIDRKLDREEALAARAAATERLREKQAEEDAALDAYNAKLAQLNPGSGPR